VFVQTLHLKLYEEEMDTLQNRPNHPHLQGVRDASRGFMTCAVLRRAKHTVFNSSFSSLWKIMEPVTKNFIQVLIKEALVPIVTILLQEIFVVSSTNSDILSLF
jgi:hypothetical protein